MIILIKDIQWFFLQNWLFAIGFKWESIYSYILYDSDPQSEIIGRPGGVLLSVHVLTGLWIFGSTYNFLVCDLDMAAKYFTCLSLMCPSSFKQ